jgi:hypothetical protein
MDADDAELSFLTAARTTTTVLLRLSPLEANIITYNSTINCIVHSIPDFHEKWDERVLAL